MSKWQECSLNDIFDIARGGSPRPIDKFLTSDPDGVNWIMIGDTDEGSKYIQRTKRRIKKEGASKSRYVKAGDFLLTNSMSFGRPYILAIDGYIHDGWLVLSPKNSNVNTDYFYHLLGSQTIYKEFERLAAGATVKNLNKDLVKGVKVKLPPLEVQKRIVSILDKADELRKKRRQSIELVKSITQAIFLEMFGDPTENTYKWPQKKLSEIIVENDSINYGVVQPGDDSEDGIPLIRVGDITKGFIDHSNLKRISQKIESNYKRSRLKGDEILVSCVGTIGCVAIVTEKEIGFNIARAVARIPPSKYLNRYFTAAYLSTDYVQRYFTSELRTVSQPTLNIKQIAETKFFIPPIALQETFEKRVAKLNKIMSTLDAHLELLNSAFYSIQQQAFAGEL